MFPDFKLTTHLPALALSSQRHRSRSPGNPSLGDGNRLHRSNPQGLSEPIHFLAAKVPGPTVPIWLNEARESTSSRGGGGQKIRQFRWAGMFAWWGEAIRLTAKIRIGKATPNALTHSCMAS